jgi:hypothetical protein
MSCALSYDLTGQEREDLSTENVKGFPYAVGQSVFVRSTRHHYIGIVRGVEEGFLVLFPAAWVLYSGMPSVHLGNVMRSSFSLPDLLDEDAKRTQGVFFQTFPDEVKVALCYILDAFPWKNPILETSPD